MATTKIKSKKPAGAPKSAKKPFGKLKSDKLAGAGSQIYPAILSKTSTQGKRHTGKSLLAKAMKRVARGK